MKTNIFPKNVYKVCSLVFSKYRWKLRDSANSCFFTWMYFKSLLSACSYPKTLIIQYRRLRSYNFKKCKFRIWFCRLWKCFKNNNNNNKKKIDSFWSPLFTFLATRTKAAVFLRENKPTTPTFNFGVSFVSVMVLQVLVHTVLFVTFLFL